MVGVRGSLALGEAVLARPAHLQHVVQRVAHVHRLHVVGADSGDDAGLRGLEAVLERRLRLVDLGGGAGGGGGRDRGGGQDGDEEGGVHPVRSVGFNLERRRRECDNE